MKLKIEDIITNAGTQSRAEINDATVKEYSELMLNNVQFPPVIVFHDSKAYYMADGFHRILAAVGANLKTIDVEIRKGTKSDCLKFALGQNANHGLRRTNSDKRHAVTVALGEWPKLSNHAIAEICQVSHSLVNDLKPSQLEAASNCPVVSASESTEPKISPVQNWRIGRDGKRYAIPPVPTMKAPVSPPPPIRPNPSTPPPPIKAPEPEPEPEIFDRTGWPIPKGIMELWNSSLKESISILHPVHTVRDRVIKAQEENDIRFTELRLQDVQMDLDTTIGRLKNIRPYAVCTSCNGRDSKNCTFCKKRGFLSKTLYDQCAPRELKDRRKQILAAKKA